MLQETENFYLQDQGKQMPTVDQELFFVIEEKNNSVELTEKGVELISRSLENKDFFIMPDLSSLLSEIESKDISAEEILKEKEAVLDDYTLKTERLHTVDKLLKAYCMFEKDVEYVLMDNQVKIVDEHGLNVHGRAPDLPSFSVTALSVNLKSDSSSLSLLFSLPPIPLAQLSVLLGRGNCKCILVNSIEGRLHWYEILSP